MDASVAARDRRVVRRRVDERRHVADQPREVAGRVLRHAEQRRDHGDRERHRERRHHLGLAALGELVEDRREQALDLGPEALDHLRRERTRHQRADAGVVRRVQEQHCLRVAVGSPRARVERRRQVHVRLGATPMRVSQVVEAVVVGGEHGHAEAALPSRRLGDEASVDGNGVLAPLVVEDDVQQEPVRLGRRQGRGRFGRGHVTLPRSAARATPYPWKSSGPASSVIGSSRSSHSLRSARLMIPCITYSVVM